MSEGVLLVGAGGFGVAVADAMLAFGTRKVAGFVDDRGSELGLILGLPVLGRVSDLEVLRQRYRFLVVAIGDNTCRRDVFLRARALGFELVTVTHPSAVISRNAKLSPGSMIMAGAVIGAMASIGDGAIVNACAVVDHHAKVGDFAHLGVGACMAGGSMLADHARLTEGAILCAGQILGLPAHADGLNR